MSKTTIAFLDGLVIGAALVLAGHLHAETAKRALHTSARDQAALTHLFREISRK